MRYNCWVLSDLTLPDFTGYSHSNRYRFEAATFADAQTLAAQLANWHRATAGNNVIIDRYRLRDDSQGIGDGYYSGSFGPGLRTYPRGVLGNVPWCMMVHLYGDGRLVGRKWLRLGFDVADLAGWDFDPTLVAYVQANYADPLGSAAVYRTVSDVLIDGARVDPRLRLRVLRHGTRRRQLLVI